jgi:hypothetical protein
MAGVIANSITASAIIDVETDAHDCNQKDELTKAIHDLYPQAIVEEISEAIPNIEAGIAPFGDEKGPSDEELRRKEQTRCLGD